MTPIPAINVNMTPCTCGYRISFAVPGTHFAGCPAVPVLIPCPIQRSVTFEVMLRDCGHKEGHPITCPWPVGYVVKVSCSISGKTWAESEVEDVEEQGIIPGERREGDVGGVEFATPEDHDRALAACRERWALVKALLLHRGDVSGHTVFTPESLSRLQQRTEVFLALEDMARAEQSAFLSQERAVKAMGEPSFLPDNFIRAEPQQRASASIFSRYVERLVEQVGVLGVAP